MSAVTIRTRHLMANPLMSRRQMVVDVAHPGRANVPKKELQERIQKLFKVKDAGQVIPFAFRTAFGGGKSTGMVNVYNSLDEAKKFTQGHILVRLGLKDKKEKKGRKGKKEAKNRQLKIRGVGRRTARKKAKRADK